MRFPVDGSSAVAYQPRRSLAPCSAASRIPPFVPRTRTAPFRESVLQSATGSRRVFVIETTRGCFAVERGKLKNSLSNEKRESDRVCSTERQIQGAARGWKEKGC